MKLKPKEKAKINKRRNLWATMGWYWLDKNGGQNDKNKSKGYGFFRNNHSLKCGCSCCKAMVYEKQYNKKQERNEGRKEVRNLLKVINNQGDIE